VLLARRVALLLVISIMGACFATGLWLWHDGFRAYVVHTGSMQPNYKSGSLVIDRPASGDYHAGQVITFRHNDLTTDVVTHRITDITSTGLIHTKGDGNGTADVWDIRPDQVRGEVVAGIPYAGYVVVFLQQPAGIAAVMTAVLAMLLLWGFFFTPEAASVESASLEPKSGGLRGRLRLPTAQVQRRTSKRGLPARGALIVVALLFVNLSAVAALLVHHSTPAEVHQTAPRVR
jgi:signal peptidase